MTAGEWLMLAVLCLILSVPFIIMAAAAPMNGYEPDDEEYERYLDDES